MKKIFLIVIAALLVIPLTAHADGFYGGGGSGSMVYPGAGIPYTPDGATWGTSFSVGTMTNLYLCTYATSGKTISCNTAAATFQAASAYLAAIAGLTPAQGKFLIGDGTPTWALSAYTVPSTVCASGYSWISDGTNMGCTAAALGTDSSSVGDIVKHTGAGTYGTPTYLTDVNYYAAVPVNQSAGGSLTQLTTAQMQNTKINNNGWTTGAQTTNFAAIGASHDFIVQNSVSIAYTWTFHSTAANLYLNKGDGTMVGPETNIIFPASFPVACVMPCSSMPIGAGYGLVCSITSATTCTGVTYN